MVVEHIDVGRRRQHEVDGRVGKEQGAGVSQRRAYRSLGERQGDDDVLNGGPLTGVGVVAACILIEVRLAPQGASEHVGQELR